MKVLEILSEAAPEARSFDIQELVKTFKTKAQVEKHVNKLWGTDKLTFNGQAFFKGSDFGPVMKKGMQVAEREIGREVEVDLEYKNEMEQFDIAVDQSQLAYVGYSQSNDMLYFGYDIWLNSEELETAFDKLYEAATGEQFDPDDRKLQKEWDAFRNKNPSMVSALVEVSSKDGKSFNADLLSIESNGFYKNTRKSSTFKSMQLIDLMLK